MNLSRDTQIIPSQRMIFDIPVCDFGWADAFTFADELASLPIGQTVISFLNANNANLALKDRDYHDILCRHIVLPDGHGIDIASRVMHGRMFPANLNGTDFVPALMTYMTTPRRVAMIGAKRDVLERAAANFAKHAPWHTFIPVSDGYFDLSQSDAVMERVRAAQPDILLVAMGSPRQEKWIDRYVGPGHARLIIGVGALFDFVADEMPRASQGVRQLRLEWLHRLVHEPRRLWRRYIIGNPLFLYRVLRHKLTSGAKGSSRQPRRIGQRLL
ncbi:MULTISPECIES: WecB/TagA/CpsF family glycosyltransferase [unclassified Rhizobium]|uniref:WecB/TagA/CpsF family glycosyltransferase n=1 Tax=unclassified Rhizobium TaxID=2613769 RepID=UPI0006F931D5|nr:MULTISPECIES: WecB/TagA/CpsF family glycosyltransferase [unclassified Rhizobium]KQV43864.1 UDP-N-acetyl-D-mannosaminuronic acid transferase [Rhizobium sp. Root1212]KRD38046.1 UDP-N-acetyl-D-mannosaminuronic acid transferase [Rhizobium sp. Root268]